MKDKKSEALLKKGLNTMEDSKIVEMYFARSESAITETRNKYGRYCYRISFGILSDGRDAEECVNDAFLKAWEAIPPHRPERLSTFLGKITRNLSLSRYKKRNAKKRSGVSFALDELRDCVPGGSGDIADDIALRDALDSFLRSLPDETRIIFMQRYWYLYSVKEIAAAHSFKESRVKMLLFRTREKLKEHLEKEGIAL